MDENKNFRDINDASQFETEESTDSIIKVIGVGGGGGNAVNYMFKQNIPLIKFVVCNTDKQALDKSPVPNKLLLGYSVTKGLGAGNVPDVGRQCAEASLEDIQSLFDDETQMVFITAGMGGGTGTGAAPVIARAAKEAGMLTIGIVTVPFLFEGKKKIQQALAGADEMKKHVDALLIINNENIISLYKDFSFVNAFSKADDALANAARSISEIISESLDINVDFQDVKTTLKDSGSAIIATAIGEGENRITDAIEKALHSPLLKKHDIRTSKRLLIKFVCAYNSENPIRAEEMGEINNFTSELPSNIDVKWGFGDNPEMGDKVKVTILASGFDVTIAEDNDEDGTVIFRGSKQEQMEEKAKEKQNTNVDRQIEDIYGKEKVKEQERDTARLKYAVLKPGQFDDHEVIALFWRNPTFNRPQYIKDELRNPGEGKDFGTRKADADKGTGSKNEITFSFEKSE